MQHVQRRYIEAGLAEVSQLSSVQTPEKSLISIATDGKSILAACSIYQWQLEAGIRDGQVIKIMFETDDLILIDLNFEAAEGGTDSTA